MITRKEFTEQVEKLLIGNRTDIMSAILKVCELNNVEPEGAKRLLSAPLKEKLTAEAEKLKLINRDKASRCLLYTSPSPRDGCRSRMPSSA